MNDIDQIDLEAAADSPRRPATLGRPVRPRSLVQQFTTVLMRPVLFFRTLPPAGESRQWMVAALLILALMGVVAVRHQTLSAASAGGDLSGEIPFDPGLGGEFDGGGDFGGEFGGGGDFGGPPPGVDPNTGGGGPTASTTTDDLTTALLVGADVVVGWTTLALILTVVPMFNGVAPKLGVGFQVAVWATVPLALMAVIQLLYYAGGGQPGAQGLAGLLPDLDFYNTMPPLLQAVTLSLAGKFTLFWVWSIALAYYGARHALDGKIYIVPVVIVIWVVAQVVLPVASGKVTVPEAAPETEDMGMDGEMMIDPETGMMFDPITGQPIDPMTGMPVEFTPEPGAERPSSPPVEGERGEPLP
ncbi:MAG: YIP1 family protein [Anaerolineae bacterium]|jgi:hypothetical protein|nr:YIP1 family protein [Anaerolineae bacterium]